MLVKATLCDAHAVAAGLDEGEGKGAVGVVVELPVADRDEARRAGIVAEAVVAGQRGGNANGSRGLLGLGYALVGHDQRGQRGVAIENARLQGGEQQGSRAVAHKEKE